MAEIKFLGYLTEVAGERKKEVVLEAPKRLRDLLPASFPTDNLIVLIDDKAGTLDSWIDNRTSVVLLPIISGG